MRKKVKEINYQTLSEITNLISSAKDMTKTAKQLTQKLAEVLDVKGCALMLLNRRSKELEVAASYGLSRFYLTKGPLSAAKSIAASLTEGPVAIYNVRDDPRLQYPDEANREGIESLVSVPLVLRGKPLGVLRLYSAVPWEVTHPQLTFMQAIATVIALVLDNIRMANAYKTSIEVLKVLRPVIRPMKRTLNE